jgi:hypothetical protein
MSEISIGNIESADAQDSFLNLGLHTVKVANGDVLKLSRGGSLQLAVTPEMAERYPQLKIECVQVSELKESVTSVASILKITNASGNFQNT